jgi:hypothetical protein
MFRYPDFRDNFDFFFVRLPFDRFHVERNRRFNGYRNNLSMAIF